MNFEPEGLGSSVELTGMPRIGFMKRIMISHITAVDGEEMKKVNYRFHDDVMGSVRGEEIPSSYPAVVDRLTEPEAENDERVPYCIEHCEVVRQDIQCKK